MNFTKAAKGIEYWFRFHQIVGKSDLLNEDSIKFPLVEYLIADGNDSLKNIKLEDTHPVFISREVDLISKNTNQINYVIEFKLAGKLTMKVQERQRIFDDIARLFYVNSKCKTNAYLIIAGKTIDFLSEFRSVIDKRPGQRGRKKKMDEKPKLDLINPSGFFSDKWLSFDLKKPLKEIKINDESQNVYKDHYETFKKEYLVNEQKDLEIPDVINTTLEYITEIKEENATGDVPAMVGIWRIS